MAPKLLPRARFGKRRGTRAGAPGGRSQYYMTGPDGSRSRGWWHFLNKSRIMDQVRVGFLGVHPSEQHTGVAAALYVEHYDTAERMPQKGGEMGWILETNEAMNKGMEAMGAKVVKRYRVFERLLADGAG